MAWEEINYRRQHRNSCFGHQVKRVEVDLRPKVRTIRRTHAYKLFPGIKIDNATELTIPYQTRPTIHESLTRKSYIYKTDILVTIQWIVKELYWNDTHLNALVAYYLKGIEQNLRNRCELVRYDELAFRDLENQICNLRNFNKKYPPAVTKPVGVHEAYSQLKCILIPHVLDQRYSEVLKVLRDYDKIKGNNVENLYRNVIDILYSIRDFAQDHPKWFKNEPLRRFSGKVIIRLFENAKNMKFVLAWELMKEMDRAKLEVSKEMQKKISKMHKLDTVPFLELFKILGKDGMKLLEFVQVPMLQLNNERSRGYHYVVRKGQQLMDMMLKHIRFHRCFHKLSHQKGQEIVGIFELMATDYNDISNGPNLVNMDRMRTADALRLGLFSQQETGIDVKPMKMNRGIPTSRVKEEIQRLGVAETFPDIHKHIEHAEATASPDGRPLITTHDLRMIVAKAQLYSIVENSCIIRSFLHSTGECCTVLEHCDECFQRRAFKTIEDLCQQLTIFKHVEDGKLQFPNY
ncbi:unnamed protein product [Caenorhabditis nigoni]